LLAWLNPEAMTEKLFEEIDNQLKTDGALSGPEREQKIHQLTAKVNRLARDEESLIEAAMVQGLAMARRINAPPGAVLGVKIAARQNEVVAA
jgi:hypothetical protein